MGYDECWTRKSQRGEGKNASKYNAWDLTLSGSSTTTADEYRLEAELDCSNGDRTSMISRMWIYAYEDKNGMNGTLHVFQDGNNIESRQSNTYGGYIFELL